MSVIRIDYGDVVNPRFVILTSSLSVLLILMLVYLNPANHGWWNSPEFSWSNLLQFIFIDQILIECITVLIIILMLKFYAEKLRLKKVKLTRRELVKYELIFLPIPFIAFFLFNPFTQTVRFIYHNFPYLDWTIYREEYFYSLELYLTYLPVSFLQIYWVLNYNLFTNRNQNGKLKNEVMGRSFLEVSTPSGKKMIDKAEILFCEKKNRKYYIKSGSVLYTTTMTLSQLEDILPPNQFVRINRSVIIKIDAIESYSFWENDKYIMRIKEGREFPMSRARLNLIKSKLKLNP